LSSEKYIFIAYPVSVHNNRLQLLENLSQLKFPRID